MPTIINGLTLRLPKLVKNEERVIRWLELINSSGYLIPSLSTFRPTTIPFKDQIEMDVARAFSQYQDIAPNQLHQLKRCLQGLLFTFFAHHPHYHYYQGFHDLASVIVVLLPHYQDAYRVLDYIASHYLLTFLLTNDLNILPLLIDTMLAIISEVDPPVYNQLQQSTVPPYFCISWLMTWFAHDVRSVEMAAQLFDFFLLNPPLVIIYTAAAVPILMRNELLRMNNQQIQQGEAHQWLKMLPSHLLSSSLILQTSHLLRKCPVERIFLKKQHTLLRQSIYGRKLDLVIPESKRDVSQVWVIMTGVIIFILSLWLAQPGGHLFQGCLSSEQLVFS